ncbi:MAG: ANTAR domain-containing response regulator [Planctomycetota bacterium]
MSASGKPAEPIRVAVVADTTGAAGEIARSLRDSGYAVRAFSLAAGGSYDRVQDLRPAVVLLRTSARSFSLALAFARIGANGRPALALLTPAGSRQAIKLALDIGAFVHLVEPVPAQALAAGVRLAAARADGLWELRRRLTQTRESLQDRRALDRAKAILMRRFGVSEEEAHRTLQRESRNRNRKLVDTAWHVIRADARIRVRPGSASPATSRSA